MLSASQPSSSNNISAEITYQCGGEANVTLSQDGGQTFALFSPNDTSEDTLVVNDIWSDTVLQFACNRAFEAGVSRSGFIASVQYNSQLQLYETTNPITDGVFLVVSPLSVNLSYSEYVMDNSSSSAAFSSAAFWIWSADEEEQAMIFEFRFGSLLWTSTPVPTEKESSPASIVLFGLITLDTMGIFIVAAVGAFIFLVCCFLCGYCVCVRRRRKKRARNEDEVVVNIQASPKKAKPEDNPDLMFRPKLNGAAMASSVPSSSSMHPQSRMNPTTYLSMHGSPIMSMPGHGSVNNGLSPSFNHAMSGFGHFGGNPPSISLNNAHFGPGSARNSANFAPRSPQQINMAAMSQVKSVSSNNSPLPAAPQVHIEERLENDEIDESESSSNSSTRSSNSIEDDPYAQYAIKLSNEVDQPQQPVMVSIPQLPRPAGNAANASINDVQIVQHVHVVAPSDVMHNADHLPREESASLSDGMYNNDHNADAAQHATPNNNNALDDSDDADDDIFGTYQPNQPTSLGETNYM